MLPLIDGAMLAQASLRRYLHGDVVSAERLLAKSATPGLLVTDGVFSMDGDVAPLLELSRLARQHEWMFMMDDAHGLGCLGEQGKGCLSLSGLNANSLPILVGTFGKAFGTAGAFVATSHDYAGYPTRVCSALCVYHIDVASHCECDVGVVADYSVSRRSG